MSPAAPDPPAREVCETAVDWAALYDRHPEYTARRGGDSYSRGLIDLEVRLFKRPNLLEVLGEPPAASLVEIGCATGELTAAFPVASGGRRVGVDISLQNIEAACRRFPDCEVLAGDLRTCGLGGFDVVLLSDVLEHVPDDAGFLSSAAALGRRLFASNLFALASPLD